jgi:glutaredoxin
MSVKKALVSKIYDVIGVAGIALKPVEDAGSSLFRNRSAAAPRAVPGHTLYHFQFSPYAYRVRRAMRRIGLVIPLRDVLLDQEAFRELVKQGGKDQVPCLRIDSPEGTRWMYESKDIVEYLNRLPVQS